MPCMDTLSGLSLYFLATSPSDSRFGKLGGTFVRIVTKKPFAVSTCRVLTDIHRRANREAFNLGELEEPVT